MIIGYLSKDKKIYDMNGDFVKGYKIADDEKIISSDENLEISGITKGWKPISAGKDVRKFDGGNGTLIETNKRLIFYRKIRPLDKFGTTSFIIDALAKTMDATKCKKLELKEYFEIDIKEIEGVKKYCLGLSTRLCLISNGNRYSIGVSSKSEVLKDFLSKKI